MTTTHARRRIVTLFVLVFLDFISPGLATDSGAKESAWRPIFDGRTLDGWKAPDMSYFSVEDGAITGTTTRQHNPPENQFIVWQDGTVDNFSNLAVRQTHTLTKGTGTP